MIFFIFQFLWNHQKEFDLLVSIESYFNPFEVKVPLKQTGYSFEFMLKGLKFPTKFPAKPYTPWLLVTFIPTMSPSLVTTSICCI